MSRDHHQPADAIIHEGVCVGAFSHFPSLPICTPPTQSCRQAHTYIHASSIMPATILLVTFWHSLVLNKSPTPQADNAGLRAIMPARFTHVHTHTHTPHLPPGKVGSCTVFDRHGRCFLSPSGPPSVVCGRPCLGLGGGKRQIWLVSQQLGLVF